MAGTDVCLKEATFDVVTSFMFIRSKMSLKSSIRRDLNVIQMTKFNLHKEKLKKNFA